MRFDAAQIVGMVLLVFGAQGAVRLLFDHDSAGLLAWVPGGFAVRLTCYLTLTAGGLVLAGWANDHAKKLGRRK